MSEPNPANKLKGKIPTSVTLNAYLESLNLSSNALDGEIPTSFGDLISLKNVSLASNSLSGSIPDSIVSIGVGIGVEEQSGLGFERRGVGSEGETDGEMREKEE